MITDAIGTPHAQSKPNARIVSLVPSLTELLFTMGLGNQVVGRTHYCIHPEKEVDRVPRVGGTKKINVNKLADLQPDYVVLNIDENPRDMFDELMALDIRCLVTHPKTVADNAELFRWFGYLFDRKAQAEALSVRLDQHIQSIKLFAANNSPKRVLYLIWKDPWMTISSGTYIADFLSLAGWQVTRVPSTDRYPAISLGDIDLASIDLILFSTEPFAFSQSHLVEFGHAYPAQAAKAHLIDGEMVSWYGSRAIQGLAYLEAFAKRLAE